MMCTGLSHRDRGLSNGWSDRLTDLARDSSQMDHALNSVECRVHHPRTIVIRSTFTRPFDHLSLFVHSMQGANIAVPSFEGTSDR